MDQINNWPQAITVIGIAFAAALVIVVFISKMS
jgi:hypothetical protein